MPDNLRILHLEDDPDYSGLVRDLLDKDGISSSLELAKDRKEFIAALGREKFDLILADYHLPDINGLQALEIAQANGAETPFVIVSGTIGEEAAIASLRAGATDYVLKQWPERLVPAVRRAAREAAERRRRKEAEGELHRQENYFRALTDNSLDVVSLLTTDGVFLYNSPSIRRVLGHEAKQLAGCSIFECVHPGDLARVREAFLHAAAHPNLALTLEFRFRARDGSWVDLEAVGQNRVDDPNIGGFVVNSRDITERKLSDERLARSEKEYRLLFHGNPNPMWVFDIETLRLLEVNDAAVRHYGYSREEFLKMSLKDLRADAADDGAGPSFKESLQSGAQQTRVWHHRKRDGALIDVELKWSPIAFKGCHAALTLAHDVTERLDAEKALLESEAQFRDLFENSPDAVFVEDLDGNVLDVNPAACRLHGMAREELVGMNVADLVPPDQNQNVKALFQQMTAGKVTRLEGESFAADGHITPVEIRASRIEYRGRPALLLHVRDISDRRQAESALRSSEMLFHSIWENSVDGMRLTDDKGTIVAVNDAYCQMVGQARNELEGRAFTVVLAADQSIESLQDQYRAGFAAREAARRVETHVTLRSGPAVTLESSGSFIELRGQSPLLLTIFRDVTAQRRLEEQLRQAQKMEAIGQLAGGVAHDFNNILTVIHGHASLLTASNSLAGPAARSAQQIAQAAERASGLTRQLLTFSRRQVMQPKRLDLNEVVGNMTKMLGRILGEDIVLDVNYWSQPPLVRADSSMMEQVVLNLAVNARDAMPKGGRLGVNISVVDITEGCALQRPESRAGRFVCLTASDAGCGIAQENLRRIFEPFFTTKEIGKGTGLGLATVYGIIKQHQGWIEVESELNQGTTFKVYIPSAGGGAEKAEDKVDPAAVRGGTETILVVEDEPPVRELVCNCLQGHGYRVLEAGSGVKALDVWREHKESIHLLLTDLVMPDRMNGRELADILRAEKPGLKVIFTSGYSADVVGQEFVLRPGLNYLQKPYHPHTLALTVRDCLDAVSIAEGV